MEKLHWKKRERILRQIEKREQANQKKRTRRWLYSAKRKNKELEKEPWMKKHCKKAGRSKSSISKLKTVILSGNASHVDYDNFA